MSLPRLFGPGVAMVFMSIYFFWSARDAHKTGEIRRWLIGSKGGIEIAPLIRRRSPKLFWARVGLYYAVGVAFIAAGILFFLAP